MTNTVNFHKFISLIKKKKIFMMIGNGTNNQFRYISKTKTLLKNLLKQVPAGAVFLYFGDSANKKKPDVGYLFQLLHELRPDILIYMIQIDAAKSWGVPDFVSTVYWHGNYTKKSCMWGGVKNGVACSNTAKWVRVNKRVGITKIFIFGGGAITLDEYKLAKKLKIPYAYFPVERKYLGDKKTKVTSNMGKKQRVGITMGKIK
jgi:hypothetical protein